jgi:hypothetical protein
VKEMVDRTRDKPEGGIVVVQAASKDHGAEDLVGCCVLSQGCIGPCGRMHKGREREAERGEKNESEDEELERRFRARERERDRERRVRKLGRERQADTVTIRSTLWIERVHSDAKATVPIVDEDRLHGAVPLDTVLRERA